MKIYKEKHKAYQRTNVLFTYYKHIIMFLYFVFHFISVWILTYKLIYSSCHRHISELYLLSFDMIHK
jgi:hypothetical protein